MFDLSGKWALVTGSSRGIGKGVAFALAEAGADIVVNYAGSADKAAEVASEIQTMGRRALVIQADVSKPEDVNRMFDEIEAKIGGVDILVNNAGVVTSPTFDDLSLEEGDHIFDCNIFFKLKLGIRKVPKPFYSVVRKLFGGFQNRIFR